MVEDADWNYEVGLLEVRAPDAISTAECCRHLGIL